MELILLAFTFCVALILACVLILVVFWITDKRYEQRVKRRKELRGAFDRIYGGALKESKEDWQFPERWSPTKGEAHLGKTKIGEEP